jgi:hypothetical protein
MGYTQDRKNQELDRTIKQISGKRSISPRAVEHILRSMGEVLMYLFKNRMTVVVSGYLTFIRLSKDNLQAKPKPKADE